jgi:hypothetical protein
VCTAVPPQAALLSPVQPTQAGHGAGHSWATCCGWAGGRTSTHSMLSMRLRHSGPQPTVAVSVAQIFLHWQIMMSSSSCSLRSRCVYRLLVTSCHTGGRLCGRRGTPPGTSEGAAAAAAAAGAVSPATAAGAACRGQLGMECASAACTHSGAGCWASVVVELGGKRQRWTIPHPGASACRTHVVSLEHVDFCICELLRDVATAVLVIWVVLAIPGPGKEPSRVCSSGRRGGDAA